MSPLLWLGALALLALRWWRSRRGPWPRDDMGMPPGVQYGKDGDE